VVENQWNLAAIALGSNLGNSPLILKSAIEAIAHTKAVLLQAESSFYQTVAVGPAQPDYLNACVIVKTSLSPFALLNALLAIEQQFGRVRHHRWGPRFLDLDLLLFDDLILDTPNLQIPHPRMVNRAFVLVPLAEIAADWIEPISGKSITELVEAVDCSGVKSNFKV